MKLAPLLGAFSLALAGHLRAQSTVPTLVAPPASQTLPEDSAPYTLDLGTVFSVPGVSGQVVQFDTILGRFNVELLASAAPNHVANFLSYLNAGAYSGTLFHRVAYFEGSLAGPSILQGGGYYYSSGLPAVPKRPAVNLEYSLPNARGTLAAARTSDPNSATSEWYFNTRDNTTILGPLNDGYGYTVFGRVIGTGMSIVDALANQQLYNLGFGTVTPLISYQSQLYYCAVYGISSLPLFPSATGQNAVVSLSLSGGDAAVATATLVNGRTLSIAPLSPGQTTLTLTAVDTQGNQAQTTLSVTVTADPLADYLAAAGVPVEQRAPEADPDGDGLPNLLEYALGLSPVTSTTAGLPTLTAGPDRLELTYKRVRSDIVYTVQTAGSLAGAEWTSLGVDQGTPAADGSTTASVAFSGTARFLRLQVSRAP